MDQRLSPLRDYVPECNITVQTVERDGVAITTLMSGQSGVFVASGQPGPQHIPEIETPLRGTTIQAVHDTIVADARAGTYGSY